jgi:hypothetical protein
LIKFFLINYIRIAISVVRELVPFFISRGSSCQVLHSVVGQKNRPQINGK